MPVTKLSYGGCDMYMPRMHSNPSITIFILYIHRVDNRRLCDWSVTSEWKCCDLQLQPSHQLCNYCG